jgi:putative transposase
MPVRHTGSATLPSKRTPAQTWVIPPAINGLQNRIFSGFMIEEILMKTSRFREPQILAILRQAEGGVPVPELCREHGMSTASFYKWQSKYGGMDASMISQMKALEDENRRLKKMYTEMSMQAELLKEALGKSDAAISTPGDGRESSGVARGEHCACLPHVRGQRDQLSLQRQLNDENEQIADLLFGLTRAKKTWGFGLCFLYLRNVRGHRWNHKRVYRIYRELELNLRISHASI